MSRFICELFQCTIGVSHVMLVTCLLMCLSVSPFSQAEPDIYRDQSPMMIHMLIFMLLPGQSEAE